MRDLQARIIEELHVEPVVDPADQVRRRVDFLKAYLAASGAKGLVLGISGGQDSSLAGRLCQLAVGWWVLAGTALIVIGCYIAVRPPRKPEEVTLEASL